MAKKANRTPEKRVCAYHTDRECTCIKPAVTQEDVASRRKADRWAKAWGTDEMDVLIKEVKFRRSSVCSPD